MSQSRAQAPDQQESRPESQSAAEKDLTPEQIIEQFAQKESEFYEAWMQYMYTQTAVIKVLSVDGVPKNETLRIVSEVVFNDDGTREVNILRRSGGLRSVGFTDEDRGSAREPASFRADGQRDSSLQPEIRGQREGRRTGLPCFFRETEENAIRGRCILKGKFMWMIRICRL